MKAIAAILILAGLGIFAWLMTRLSSDAIGMSLGIVFGILACVPVLLVMLSERGSASSRYDSYNDGLRDGRRAADDQIRLLQAELQRTQKRLSVIQRHQVGDKWIDVDTWIAIETRQP